ncbi:bifunctional phosphoribosyl-AMP cyclohydrolase/phosphoribosyl-ATP diphosphatase HisIE [Garciella nitratireducens]|uniref:Histidine biosynthesis bifunctional protein HisIE n=1 Tax=Garciella nitratireducens DSM 15102 TaxID=1121911 RepID=A0A1T4KNU1_9FIRM|nr:bifunctional phosphoribosyl-AMP cyclohydrolase/phosphoribosyl-ATP diphosphatase HisIE [Garciella nitratireducens]RBP40273.1 phosphoribosyl-ATP pyrophosphatase /phosphoribosyl-AMP cyclohydrolase [Garciella nitratireducens]SJZ44053.1 phosphoribosyl-ATP pyrophosphatase /phosphoribosyl-AMP cyclohydrolase [Garciella nitratireducens DSM 15102]
MDEILEKVNFDEKGLLPAIVQDIVSNEVLMLAYMNKESLKKTLETKTTWFYSRSRQKLWNKGETSGNIQIVKELSYDCDGDTVLVKVMQKGNACHTGQKSCFFHQVYKENGYAKKENILHLLYQRIEYRKKNPKEGSYTNYLFREGLDKILKKVGEESSEVIIGAKNLSKEEVIYETADLTYHIFVLLIELGISIEEIKQELIKRFQ